MSKNKQQNQNNAPKDAPQQDAPKDQDQKQDVTQQGDGAEKLEGAAPPADGQENPQPPLENPDATPAHVEGANKGDQEEQAAQAEEPKADGVEGLREEIRAQLAGHLETLRDDVNKFLESEVKPLRDDVTAMGKHLDEVDQKLGLLAAASPEGAAAILADVQKLIADIKPTLDRIPALEGKLKHFL